MKILAWLLVAVVSAGLTGCSTVANLPGRVVSHVSQCAKAINDNFLAAEKVKDAQRQLLLDEMETERQALLDEALAEHALDESDRQYRAAALKGECLKRQDINRAAFRESVRSKLGLHVDQDFELGQPVIDAEELQKLLVRQKRTAALQEQLHEDAMLDWEAAQRAAIINRHRRTAGLGDAAPLPFGGAEDFCCMTSPNDCASPPRRTSPLMEQPPPAPLRQDLLPSQIPMVLPIKFNVQMQPLAVESSEVRRLPLKSPCPKTCPVKEGCTDCTTLKAAPEKVAPAPAVVEPAEYLEDLDAVK